MYRAITATVILILLAGCGGGPGVDGTSTVEAPTNISGLSDSGIQDPYELAETHRETLDGKSYTRKKSLEIVAQNGTTLVNESTTLTIQANRSWFNYHYDLDIAPWGIYGAANGTYTAYANGTQVWVKQVYPDGTNTTSRVSGTTGEPTPPTEFWLTEQPTAHRDIGARYQAIQPGNVTRTSTGFVIRSERLAVSQVEFENLPVTNVTAVSFSANLTAEGMVESYHIEVTGELEGTQVTARESITFSEVGTADAAEPSWFSRSLSN